MTTASPVGVVVHRPVADAAVRLVCFPYAGGGSSAYAGWPRHLDGRVEVVAVQLPGREARLMRPAFTDLDALVPAVGEALEPYRDRPLAFFGHSMGALLAFELARWSRARGQDGPVRLFVSARPAPHLRATPPPGLSEPDDVVLTRLARLGGTPPELLADRRLMSLLLPTLRADFAVVRGYRYRPDPPLPCPVTACGGVDDPEVGRADLAAWAGHTASSFDLRMFPGGHFYLRDSAAALLRVVRESLT
ncbi:thioesterase II family protein [Saccharothrix obliqua]|uniref:thioesterase II family protein n=1 Tax=Saccharothrix obliqua TaxID=2861747 RepID=UPI0027E2B870|nr:alpha/beta fold hydrolase [Saccharothrix obliqua]